MATLQKLAAAADDDAARTRLAESMTENPVQADWLATDFSGRLALLRAPVAERIAAFDGLAKKYAEKNSAAASAVSATPSKTLAEAAAKYLAERGKNRERFLKKLSAKGRPKEYVYVERKPITPSFYAYTEGLSDARGESHFLPDSKLCRLAVAEDGSIKREVLLESKTGVIRDPDVSYDAKKILFAWKKDKSDDYSLYEMDAETGQIRLITKSPKHADYEGRYLPTGEIVFSSTRCGHSTDCFNTEVSNLYIMRPDGTALRRVGFDQVHTTYPTVCENGDVVYTRWDYNDRGQVYTQAAFTMKPDGSFQTELYGNKSWIPTAMGHIRQIPGEPSKFVCILHGHHTPQQGHLAKFDVKKGRQNGDGMSALAPVRKIPPRADAYAQDGPQFRYPFPLEDGLYLASINPLSVHWRESKTARKFRALPFLLCLVNDDGERELLLGGPPSGKLSQMQIAPLEKRPLPAIAKSPLDYSNKSGYCLIRDVYAGRGTAGVKRGDIEKIRVIKLHYRRAPVGIMHMVGPGGVGTCHTPIALGNASWDAKEILGEVEVEKDGSVYFEVPARTPVYFQPIDKNGCAVNTMRSWTTMQPNEFYACLGCHGDKNLNSRADARLDSSRKPKKLKPFYDVRGGFSFRKHIQPILNRNCIHCHNDRSAHRLFDHADASKTLSVEDLAPVKDEAVRAFIKDCEGEVRRAFSLLDVPIPNALAKRNFNDAYYNLLRPSVRNAKHPYMADCNSELVNWLGAQSSPELQPPYKRGSATSKLYMMLSQRHSGLNLSKEELDKICAWIDLYVPYCGDYLESNTWTPKERKFYDYYAEKAARAQAEEDEQIKKYLAPKERH